MSKSQVLTNVPTVDQAGLSTFAKFTIACGRNQMVFGPAGSGKTEICIQSAQEEKYDIVYLNLSVLEAPDLVGLPMINEANCSTKYALPESFPRRPEKPAEGHKGRILVVDEIDKAKPELQNPMLELFQYRSINGQPLDFHAVLATGNRPDEGAFSLPVNKALTNRCKVYRMEPKFEPWQQWAVGVGLNGLVTGFLSRHNEYFFKPDSSGDMTAYCAPSARSWSNAANDLDEAEANHGHDMNFQQQLVAGYVGVEAAIKFQVWLEHYKEIYPAVDALIQHGKKPDLSGATMDKIIVTAIASVQEISRRCGDTAPSKKDITDTQKVVKVVSSFLKDMSPDVQIAAMKSVLSVPKIVAYKMAEVPEFMEVFRNINKSFKGN